MNLPVPLLADVGIPMIVVTLPGMIVLLLPVILIETLFITKRTSNPRWQVFEATAAANAFPVDSVIPPSGSLSGQPRR